MSIRLTGRFPCSGFIFRHRAARESPTDDIHQFYDIHCVLGSGAFTTVMKALHKEERQWYAIKSFPGEPAQELLAGSRTSRRTETMQSAWKHLEREMKVLKRLRHRNICQLKETFMEPGNSISESIRVFCARVVNKVEGGCGSLQALCSNTSTAGT